MTLQVTPVRREFTYNGAALADPDSSLTPEQVLEFYATNSFKELGNAEVQYDGTSDDGSVARYSFARVVGTKG